MEQSNLFANVLRSKWRPENLQQAQKADSAQTGSWIGILFHHDDKLEEDEYAKPSDEEKGADEKNELNATAAKDTETSEEKKTGKDLHQNDKSNEDASTNQSSIDEGKSADEKIELKTTAAKDTETSEEKKASSWSWGLFHQDGKSNEDVCDKPSPVEEGKQANAQHCKDSIDISITL